MSRSEPARAILGSRGAGRDPVEFALKARLPPLYRGVVRGQGQTGNGSTDRRGAAGSVPFLSVLIFVALGLRLVPLLFGIESTDIFLYREQAEPVLRHQNIYETGAAVFPYTPVSMFYAPLSLVMSERLGVPFPVVIKGFSIASDLAIVLALYVFGVRVGSRRTALCSSGLYALNPVSILVASAHGNIMTFVVLLVLVAYLLFSLDRERHAAASALVLGVAIGWRSFPVLLLPFFLLEIDSWKDRCRFAGYALVPVLLSLLPFLLVSPAATFEAITGYAGWGIHHGPFGVLRARYLLRLSEITWEDPPGWERIYALSRVAYLTLVGAGLVFARRVALLNRILLVFLGFYLLYASVASQYLIWVLPFLLLLNSHRAFVVYVGAASYALVVFYGTFFPDILFGTLRPPAVALPALLAHYQISEFVLSLVCLWIAVELMRNRLTPAVWKGEEGVVGRLL